MRGRRGEEEEGRGARGQDVSLVRLLAGCCVPFFDFSRFCFALCFILHMYIACMVLVAYDTLAGLSTLVPLSSSPFASFPCLHSQYDGPPVLFYALSSLSPVITPPWPGGDSAP